MRALTIGCVAMALLVQPGLLMSQQQQSTQTSPSPSDPTKNNPDVPRQAPNTDNPDMAPTHQPAPGGTGATSTAKSSKHKKNKKSNTSSTTSTSGS
jgi:hypothetical protein